MAYHLVVTSPFANRKVGDRIEDAADVAQILNSHQAHYVVKVDVEDKPKPKADAK